MAPGSKDLIGRKRSLESDSDSDGDSSSVHGRRRRISRRLFGADSPSAAWHGEAAEPEAPPAPESEELEPVPEPVLEPEPEPESEGETSDAPPSSPPPFVIIAQPEGEEFADAFAAPPELLVAHPQGHVYIVHVEEVEPIAFMEPGNDEPREFVEFEFGGFMPEPDEGGMDIAAVSYQELLDLEDLGLVDCDGIPSEEIPNFIQEGIASPGSEETCTVCMEEYVEGEGTGTLGCSHRFHRDCIAKYLHMKERPKCPLCNQDPAPLP